MIHSNIPKRPTLLAAAGLAVALVLGFALNPTPDQDISGPRLPLRRRRDAPRHRERPQ